MRVNVTIDEDLKLMADMKYNNLSQRINELLMIDLDKSDKKAELVKKLHDIKLEEKIVTKQICEMEKHEKNSKNGEDNMQAVLRWAFEVYQRRGVLGLNILKNECANKKVDYTVVKQKLEDEEVAMVKYDAV